MAFKEVQDLNCETTVSLGGVQKKTNKPNPKQIEGYYLGRREVEDKKKKSGVSYIYVIQTQKGNIGVWGKTDMDRKMSAAPVGSMIRITHTGFQSTANGEMYKYRVEVDSDNTIDITLLEQGATDSADTVSDTTASDDEGDVEEDLFGDAPEADVVVAARPKVSTARPASVPSASAQAKVQELLRSRTAAKTN